MTEKELERIIAQVARQQKTAPAVVRREMEVAMEAAMADTDPAVQARWARIPRKGEKITLEEFMEYALGMLNRS